MTRGIATIKLSDYIRYQGGQNYGDFGKFIEAMNRIGGDRLLALDTVGDATIQQPVNQQVFGYIEGMRYALLPEEAGLAHVELANEPREVTGAGQQMMVDFTEAILELSR